MQGTHISWQAKVARAPARHDRSGSALSSKSLFPGKISFSLALVCTMAIPANQEAGAGAAANGAKTLRILTEEY